MPFCKTIAGGFVGGVMSNGSDDDGGTGALEKRWRMPFEISLASRILMVTRGRDDEEPSVRLLTSSTSFNQAESRLVQQAEQA